MAELSIGGTIDLEVGGNKISLLSTLAIHFYYSSTMHCYQAAIRCCHRNHHRSPQCKWGWRENYYIEILPMARQRGILTSSQCFPLTTLKSVSVRLSVVHLRSVSKCKTLNWNSKVQHRRHCLCSGETYCWCTSGERQLFGGRAFLSGNLHSPTRST